MVCVPSAGVDRYMSALAAYGYQLNVSGRRRGAVGILYDIVAISPWG